MWVECDCCGDRYCDFCDAHAADCDCPAMDVFAEYGKSPYFDSYLFKEGELMPDPGGYDVGGEDVWHPPPGYVVAADG